MSVSNSINAKRRKGNVNGWLKPQKNDERERESTRFLALVDAPDTIIIFSQTGKNEQTGRITVQKKRANRKYSIPFGSGAKTV